MTPAERSAKFREDKDRSTRILAQQIADAVFRKLKEDLLSDATGDLIARDRQ
jgi:hypothetical protein